LIALYRLAGIVADHVPTIGRNEPAAADTTAPPPLQGAGLRDLDPTTLVRAGDEDLERRGRRVWWSPAAADFSRSERLDDNAWLDRCRFVDSRQLIELTHPSDGRSLLTLETVPGWDDRAEDDPDGRPYRHAWMQLRSYVVPSGQAERLWRWLRRQAFDGRWMPRATRA
jgi:hypothetical protein